MLIVKIGSWIGGPYQSRVNPSLDGYAPRRGRTVLAALLPDGEALDDEHAAAFAAPTEPKLIAPRQALREEDRVLE